MNEFRFKIQLFSKIVKNSMRELSFYLLFSVGIRRTCSKSHSSFSFCNISRILSTYFQSPFPSICSPQTSVSPHFKFESYIPCSVYLHACIREKSNVRRWILLYPNFLFFPFLFFSPYFTSFLSFPEENECELFIKTKYCN